MIKKYAVLHPETGEYTFYATEQEAIENFWITMINFSFPFFHNTAYMTVETAEDGSEIWRNDNNQVIDKPLTHAEMLELFSKRLVPAVPNPTEVVTLP